MKPVTQLFGDSFLYACTFKKTYSYEKFVPENLLARKNQFAKSIKVPAADKAYQCVSIMLTTERLQQYALDNGIRCDERYQGVRNILLEPTNMLNGYFLSVIPYTDSDKPANKTLASIKVNEAITLLLEMRPDLESFLFDFSDPNKQNLEEFMLKNFQYNTPVEHLKPQDIYQDLGFENLSHFYTAFKHKYGVTPATINPKNK